MLTLGLVVRLLLGLRVELWLVLWLKFDLQIGLSTILGLVSVYGIELPLGLVLGID